MYRFQVGSWFNFCVADCALIMAFLSVDSPQLQGPKFDQNHGSGPHGALYAPMSTWLRGALLPEGLGITNEVSEKYTSLEKNDKKSLNSDRPCSRS